MDIVQRWSERIAQRVAPTEIDFAAEVGVAYTEGGQARKELLPRSSVGPGAFGPGIYAVDLPLILQALAAAGNALLSLLRSPYLSNALAAGSLFVALRAGHGQASDGSRPAVRMAAGSVPPPALPVSERQAVELAFESLRGRLAAAGFTEERADLLACELLEELLTDAAEATLFLDALVPDGGAQLEFPAKTKGKRTRRSSGLVLT